MFNQNAEVIDIIVDEMLVLYAALAAVGR